MKAAVTKRLVLDASVALAWCFSDESTPYTEGVLDLLAAGVEATTPAIWPLEVANALLVAERRKRITTAQVTSVLQRIASLPISVDPIPVDRAFGQILAAARDEKLTAYDAAYLELAMREGLPLATLDDQLKQSARSAGVALVRI
ncbi:MAG TPA: type II toxin-antitoxin system VapC family toxin [Candidatus Sulfotelmatobacter sp.]|nr:type II toxin-antitoxin system VapC family toxin [Candidatus Sulfotelmatobacter sp.]